MGCFYKISFDFKTKKAQYKNMKTNPKELKNLGFEQITECFGGLGCIFRKEEAGKVTLINSENSTSIIMSKAEWESINKGATSNN